MRTNKYNFWRLLSEKKITIPIVQRDYAQGRPGKEYIRKNFLEQLGKSVFGVPEQEQTELDFVYGTESKGGIKDSIEMMPLDGQQRLTTLWLLHWYVAYKAGKTDLSKFTPKEKESIKKGKWDEDNLDLEKKDILNTISTLQNFSYQTRTSSREFCQMLSQMEYHPTDNIVGLIKNQTWFYSIWEQDPTINAMLRMLSGTDNSKTKTGEFIDGIEELFQGKNDFDAYWQTLTSDECPIYFNFLPMESQEFPVSDDLYIKMNARGKPLTSFENFKAELVNWINLDEHKEWLGDNEQDRNLKRVALVSLIDNQWTDVFWENGKDLGRVDEIYFTFLNRFFYNLVILRKTDSPKKVYELTDKNYNKNRYYEYFSEIDTKMQFEDFGMYSPFLTEEVFNDLVTIMENYAESLRIFSGDKREFERIFIKPWKKDFYFIPKYISKEDNSSNSKDCSSEETSNFSILNQMERVVFYGICRYFKDGPIESGDATSLKRWMRFIWNLVSEYDKDSSIIRNISTMQTAMSIIDEVADTFILSNPLNTNSDVTQDTSGASSENSVDSVAEYPEVLEEEDPNAATVESTYLDLPPTHKIYEQLRDLAPKKLPNNKIDNNIKSQFSKRFQEEIIKSIRILQSYQEENPSVTEEMIIEAESHPQLRGSIRFLFTDDKGEIDWSSFETKWENVKSLLPFVPQERDKKDGLRTVQILPYLPENSIKKIFSDFWFSDDDYNFRKILTKYPDLMHPVLMNWGNTIDDEPSLLHRHLNEFIDADHSNYMIHTNWIDGLVVLSQYRSRRSKQGNYLDKSVLIGSDIFDEALNLLRQTSDIKIIPNQQNTKTEEDATYKPIRMPFEGLYIKFKYNVQGIDYDFRWDSRNQIKMCIGDNKPTDKEKNIKPLYTVYVPQQKQLELIENQDLPDNLENLGNSVLIERQENKKQLEERENINFTFSDSEGLIKQLDRCVAEYNELIHQTCD